MVKFKSRHLQDIVPNLRKKGSYEPKERRKIDWNSYTLNQISDIIDALKLIRKNIDESVYTQVLCRILLLLPKFDTLTSNLFQNPI